MTAPYARTADQKRHDFNQSKVFEAQVLDELGDWVVDRTDSTTEIDYWVPGFYLDVKEKRQTLTERWHLLPGVYERDLFVLDELSFRKLMAHWPYGYLLIRDVPGGDRLFVASCVTLACIERARINRNSKGKLVVNLQQFRRIGAIGEVHDLVMSDLVRMPWKQSPCIGAIETPEIQS